MSGRFAIANPRRAQSASAPVCPVRMRIAWPMSTTKILPSPIWPLLAVFRTVSMARSAMASSSAISGLISGSASRPAPPSPGSWRNYRRCAQP